ncbi:MAG: hypothetical protein NWE94_05185 [Candidatus Bathyarchaeota archaeon]|nr:hypothetical protein [Candidatus Bathyarchaeota archaeon]
MSDFSRVVMLTSTEDPYFRDALDLMFYPSAVAYRFRYNRKWVSKEFKRDNGQLSKTKIANLVGKRALIVHILTEKKNGNYEIREFLPLREALINEAIVVGEFLWLGFKLGDWVLYRNDIKENEPNQYHKILKAAICPDSMDIENRLVVQTEIIGIETIPDNAQLENTETLSNWTRIAKGISRFSKVRRDSSKNVVFMKFVRIRDATTNEILNVKAIDPGKQGFELKSERSYAIDIVEYTDQKTEPFELELQAEEEVVSPTISKTEIRGKYDVLHFLVFCKPVNRDSVSTLSFEPKTENYAISRAFFWIKIKTRKWVYVGIPLFFFAISTIFTSEQFFRLISNQAIDIGALVFGSVGTVFSTISLFYLRK